MSPTQSIWSVYDCSAIVSGGLDVRSTTTSGQLPPPPPGGQLTLYAPCTTSCLVQPVPAWPVKTPRAPFRDSRDARCCGRTTTAMRNMSTPPRPCYHLNAYPPLSLLARFRTVIFPVGCRRWRTACCSAFIGPSSARCLRCPSAFLSCSASRGCEPSPNW